ncbi:hypothetical protein SBOR_6739 [Sclerotinia borealis F-4128]|uniref:Mid2 domain-containing protein n=1 Tax=Sclerotinia borealis (strain F-4128) TaxID=1432307 RepID=W9CAK5_SCLBF|nr:hypothetical protein SBOR_6739 [Sclerotinia borealis F-4128]
MAMLYTDVVTYTNSGGPVDNTVTWLYASNSRYTPVSNEGTKVIRLTSDASISHTSLRTIFETVKTTVPSTTISVASSSTSSVNTKAVALSEISVYSSILETATDPNLKSQLSAAMSQRSTWASLTDSVITTGSGSGSTTSGSVSGSTSLHTTASTPSSKTIPPTIYIGPSGTLTTLSPSQQTAFDQASKDGAHRLVVYEVLGCLFGIFILSCTLGLLGCCCVRKRRRRRGRNAPPLTEYVSPNLSSLNGLMAEMGRKIRIGSRRRGLRELREFRGFLGR